MEDRQQAAEANGLSCLHVQLFLEQYFEFEDVYY